VLRRWGGALAVAGIAVAAYIAIADASSGAPACFAGGHGCATVAHSRYAHLLGINVAVLGVGGYLALLGAALAGGDRARLAGFALAAAGFGFSAYLTFLEVFVIDAVCQWCVASALLMTALLAVNAMRAFGYSGSDLAATNAAGQGAR